MCLSRPTGQTNNVFYSLDLTAEWISPAGDELRRLIFKTSGFITIHFHANVPAANLGNSSDVDDPQIIFN